VPAVRVGGGETEFPFPIDLRNRAKEVLSDRIGRIDNSRSVGVGYVYRVDRRDVTHEGQKTAVNGEVKRQLRFGAEAGNHLILLRWNSFLRAVGDFEGVHQRTRSRDLIKKDFRGDAEAAVNQIVVPNQRVGTIVGCASGAPASRAGAVGRQCFAYLNVVRIVI